MKKPVTFTLEESIVDKLREISKETMIPQARLVEKAISEIIEEYKSK